jgi:hypothetical protein
MDLLNKRLVEQIREKVQARTGDDIAKDVAKGVMSRETEKAISDSQNTVRSMQDAMLDVINKTINDRTPVEPSPYDDIKLGDEPEVLDEPTKDEPLDLGDGIMSPPSMQEEEELEIIADPTTDDNTINEPVADGVQPEDGKVPTEEIINELPEDIKESVEEAEPKTNEQVNAALFDATNFSGEIATPSKGEDILTWIAQNTYGLREDDPAFKKAFQSVTNVDPQKTPWCGAFAGHVLKNIGVSLPNDAKVNPALAFNYRNIGDEVYNHNPTTNTTYAGSLDAVKPGDLIVFNKANRRKDGSFAWAKGHVTFVVGVEEDGSILAVGGNQGGVDAGGGAIQTSRYSPDVIKENYKGGFTVRRITDSSLEQTDPSIIAALTKDIAEGGAGL